MTLINLTIIIAMILYLGVGVVIFQLTLKTQHNMPLHTKGILCIHLILAWPFWIVYTLAMGYDE